MILISADVAETILPVEQNLFPVSFKRKLEYEGYFMQEVIDKNKLKVMVGWMKEINQHFKDLDIDLDLIDDFC